MGLPAKPLTCLPRFLRVLVSATGSRKLQNPNQISPPFSPPKPSSHPSRRRTPASRPPTTALAMDADASRQVRVRFVTKLPPPLRAPPTAIAVPADLNRRRLSEIVNNLLLAGEHVLPALTPLVGRDVPREFR